MTVYLAKLCLSTARLATGVSCFFPNTINNIRISEVDIAALIDSW